MGLLNAADRAWMEEARRHIYDDWSRDVTIRKLSTNQATEVDELGWVESSDPVYATSYTVRAIVHPKGVVNRGLSSRDDTQSTSAGQAQELGIYARINEEDLDGNPAPDVHSELIDGTTVYRVQSADYAAGQYILTLTSDD